MSDYLHDLLGANDAQPQLSWQLTSPARGKKQAVCQVVPKGS